MTWLLCLHLLAFGGYHFADAVIYDAKLNALREGAHVLVNERGVVRLVSQKPTSTPDGATRVEAATLLPHLVDFYSLLQERGLGEDRGANAEGQGRIARAFKAAGIGAFRDPMFPPGAVSVNLSTGLTALAQNGYIELSGGPASGFAVLADPDRDLDELAAQIPDRGPVTVWWSQFGSDRPVLWPKRAAYLRRLIEYFHGRGQLVGAYIQDAGSQEMEALYAVPFDFLEGVPAADVDVDRLRAGLTWAPLACLNDKRYCAKNFERRLAQAKTLELYGQKMLDVAERRMDFALDKMKDRCRIWRGRRGEAFRGLRRWIDKGGALAVGSAGGHMFSFSGDVRSELETLEELGATPNQLLRAMFVDTPKLLGLNTPYLKVGQPANLIVYSSKRYWVKLTGRRVAMSFVNGRRIDGVASAKLND